MFEYVNTDISVRRASDAIEIAKTRAVSSAFVVVSVKRVTQKGSGYNTSYTVVLMAQAVQA